MKTALNADHHMHCADSAIEKRIRRARGSTWRVRLIQGYQNNDLSGVPSNIPPDSIIGKPVINVAPPLGLHLY